MLKLMKYEMKKQMFSKIVILLLLAIVEIFFLITVALDNNRMYALSTFLLVTFSFAVLYYLAFECIITYSNDLKNKCSYMLFLTPTTPYKIVGAKVLFSGIQIFITGLAVLGVIILDVTIVLARKGHLKLIFEYVQTFIENVLHSDINISHLFSAAVAGLFQWLFTITLAFFAITLSTTLLSNSKFRGIVSFLIFILISFIAVWILNFIHSHTSLSTSSLFIIIDIIMVTFITLTYLGTAWLLDKKISV